MALIRIAVSAPACRQESVPDRSGRESTGGDAPIQEGAHRGGHPARARSRTNGRGPALGVRGGECLV